MCFDLTFPRGNVVSKWPTPLFIQTRIVSWLFFLVIIQTTPPPLHFLVLIFLQYDIFGFIYHWNRILWCCERFLHRIIKCFSQLTNITTTPTPPLKDYTPPIPFLAHGGMSEDYIRNLNWRQKITCHNIHVFYIHWFFLYF